MITKHMPKLFEYVTGFTKIHYELHEIHFIAYGIIIIAMHKKYPWAVLSVS